MKNLRLPVFCYTCLVLLFSNCTNTEPEPNFPITLHWSKAYPGENWPAVKTGLAWSLSFLGATVPKENINQCFKLQDNQNIIFDPSKAGFTQDALEKIYHITRLLKESDEYNKNQNIDIGRFLMLTIYSSWNYFAITGTERTLNEFKAKFNTENGIEFISTSSGISMHERKITFRISNDINKMYFLAEEGSGSVLNGDFTPLEYETITIMSNGQPKFTLYDSNGNLKDAADSNLSIAGKPGKCMWCHESSLLPLYTFGTDVSGYITQDSFNTSIEEAVKILEDYRKNLNTEIVYTNKQDHAFSELLYASFMEPSVERLSKEWNMNEADVSQILSALPVHNNVEAPFLGNLFDRINVEPMAPFKSVPVPFFAREKSVYEPDFFNMHP